MRLLNTAKKLLVEKVFRKISRNLFGMRNKRAHSTGSGSNKSKINLSEKERNEMFRIPVNHRKDGDDHNGGVNIGNNNVNNINGDNGQKHTDFKLFDILQLPFR